LEVINGPRGPAANGLKLRQALPEGLELIQATTNGQFEPLNRRVVWQLGTLEPGQMQTVFVKVRCLVPGQWLSRATLTADQMAATTSEHTLAGEGGCLLNLTVQGREEHLEVNGETVYEARVVNPGTKPARNMRLSAWIPEGMAPLKADGPEGVGVRIQQQQVVFESVKQLDPKAAVVFRVRVRGQRPGVWRLRVEVLADQMARPIIDELPVSVQPDSRTRAMGNLENR